MKALEDLSRTVLELGGKTCRNHNLVGVMRILDAEAGDRLSPMAFSFIMKRALVEDQGKVLDAHERDILELPVPQDETGAERQEGSSSDLESRQDYSNQRVKKRGTDALELQVRPMPIIARE